MSASDIRPKILQWLNEMFHSVTELEDGNILVPGFGSTAVFVSVQDVFNNQYTRVRIDAPLLLDVPVSDELVQYIGIRSNDFIFGHLALILDSDGSRTGILVFRQTLLGDAIDRVELDVAANVVALTADDLDDNLQRRFGGQRFHE